MQLVAHSPLVRQTACSSPTEMPHAYKVLAATRGSHMFIDLDDRCADTILREDSASSCRHLVVSCRFHFSFPVSRFQFALLACGVVPVFSIPDSGAPVGDGGSRTDN